MTSKDIEARALTLADARRLRADRARQIADVLRRQVLHGAFRSGVLPAEADLVRDFATSRNAVRDALDLLRAEGLIERCPGVGTTVATEKYPHGLERLLGLAETLREHGEVTNEVRTTGLITPPREITARLRLAAGEPVVYIERLRRLNGLPLSLDLTYVARDLGEPLLGEDLAHTDVFVLLERISGQPLGRGELTVEAVNADPHSAAMLDAPRGAALLMVERLTHLADGRPVDLEFIRFRGDRITMSGTLRRGDSSLPVQPTEPVQPIEPVRPTEPVQPTESLEHRHVPGREPR
ncbi:GntR family transcriptional regulator [Spirillospora sp. NPDC048911]|uniref:GntR family transcriptional regulator n=1 Tax=Spirillospora sp. NPDC048911 TaxID=3364527 RepID=UPI003710BD33